MNNELQEQIRIIAEYDGWVFHPNATNGGKNNTFIKTCGDGSNVWATIENFKKYLTSLDWLHPVAMKVLDELEDIQYSSRGDSQIQGKIAVILSGIREKCFIKPINGEYVDLLDKVTEAIEYLSSNKK